MNADELRRYARRVGWMAEDREIGPGAKRDLEGTADYLRACADAMDAGPVAWAATDETGKIVEALGMNESRRFSDPLYLLARPAQAQPLRLPEPMTDEEIDALIDETGHMTTDRAVRYLVETGERRVKEVNE